MILALLLLASCSSFPDRAISSKRGVTDTKFYDCVINCVANLKDRELERCESFCDEVKQ